MKTKTKPFKDLHSFSGSVVVVTAAGDISHIAPRLSAFLKMVEKLGTGRKGAPSCTITSVRFCLSL